MSNEIAAPDRLFVGASLALFLSSFALVTARDEQSLGVLGAAPRITGLLLASTLLALRAMPRLDSSERTSPPPFLAVLLVGGVIFSLAANSLDGFSPLLVWNSAEIIVLAVYLTCVYRLPANQQQWLIRRGMWLLGIVCAWALVQGFTVPSASRRGQFLLPQISSRYPDIGANQLGVMAVAVLLALLTSRRDRLGLSRLLVVAVAGCALFAQSRSALLVAIVVGAIVLPKHLGRWEPNRQIRALAAVLCAAGLLVLALPIVLEFVVRGNAEGFLSLSNRDAAWRNVLSSIADRPLFGSGAGIGARFDEAEIIIRDKETVGTAHNMYLQLVATLGLLGGLPVALALLRISFAAMMSVWRGQAGVAETLVIFGTGVGITNSFLVGFAPMGIVFYSAAAVVWSNRHNETSRHDTYAHHKQHSYSDVPVGTGESHS